MTISHDSLGTIARTADGFEIVFERRLARPIEQVWAALTTPERIADWFAIVDLDPRLGGHYRLSFTPDETPMAGVIFEFEPLRRLAHTWPDPAHPASIVRYELAPDGDGCRLRLTQTGLSVEHAASIAGWHVFLDAIPGATEGIRTVWSSDREKAVLELYRARLAAAGAPLPDDLGLVTRQANSAWELTFERRFALPVAKVWAALTVPERIADWLAEAEVELRLGGVFRLKFPAHNYAMEGRIVELDPPRVIAWTWPHEKHPDSVVRWQLFPDGTGCRLVLTQSRLQRPELPDVAAGWHTHLECLPGAADGVNTPWRAEREREIRTLYAGLAKG